MKKYFLACLLLILFHFNSTAQDSSHIRISLLTCSPGDELYSTFGHSALRVTDSSSVQDIVFNYGTFSFDDPGFYSKFIRGKLMYFVSTSYFEDFKFDYQASNRGITEQVLNLTGDEKIAIQQFLYNNIKEENKYYKYDFLFDNCTTRLRDIIVNFKKDKPIFVPIVPVETRFRQAIHEYLDRNGKDWSKLGIDLLLGAPTDAVMTTTQAQFLPDYLMMNLDSSVVPQPIALSSKSLYPFETAKDVASFFTPVTLFAILLLLIILIDFSNKKWALIFLQGFDGLLFFVTGALGCLFIFMWLGTDHAMCKNNYNLIWAWPTHTIAAFFINSKKKLIKKYLLICLAGLVVVAASWFFLPQQLNNALLLICILLFYRSTRKYLAA